MSVNVDLEPVTMVCIFICAQVQFFFYYLAVGASAGRNGVRAARFCKRCTKTDFSSSISSILLTFFFCFWKGSPNIYKTALLTEVEAKIRDQKKIWSWKYVCCINRRGHPLHDDYWQRIGPRIKTCHGRGEREVHIDDLTLITYSVLPPPFQYITASILIKNGDRFRVSRISR